MILGVHFNEFLVESKRLEPLSLLLLDLREELEGLVAFLELGNTQNFVQSLVNSIEAPI